MCMAAGHRAAGGDLRPRVPAHGRAEARQDDDRVRAGRRRGRRRRSRSPTCRRWPWPTTSASTRCATTCCATWRWAVTATSPTRASWRATTRTWPTTWATSSRGSRPSCTPSAAGSARRCNPASELAPVAAAVLDAATAAWARWAPHEALEETWRLIGAANAELESAEPWKMEPGPGGRRRPRRRARGPAHRGHPDRAGHAVDGGRGLAPHRRGGRPVGGPCARGRPRGAATAAARPW